jgi:hypothetical protein
VVSALSDTKIKEITCGTLVKIRDTIARKSKRHAVEVLALTLKGAYDNKLITYSIAEKRAGPQGYEAVPHRPWTDDHLARFPNNAEPITRRGSAAHGLRCVEAATIKRSDIKRGRLYRTESKTRTPCVMPLARALAADLARQRLSRA